MNTSRVSCALVVFGLFATFVGTTQAIRCKTGFFRSGNRCIKCSPGYFQTQENQTSCEPCEAGTFAPFPGSFSSDHCLACSPNTFSKAGSYRCTPCPAGQPSGIKATECGYCKPGQGFNENYGCYPCKSGYYNDGTMKFCTLCPSGMRTNKQNQQTSCVKCAPGTFRDARYISFSPEFKCFPCLESTYSDQEGTEQCKLCPLGSTSEMGSTKCTSCPPGTYRGNVKDRKCTPCEAGTYSKGLNPARCKHPFKGCPWGSFEDVFGECRACMPGERLDRARKICVRCADNEVSPGGAVTRCTQCPPDREPASTITVYEKSFCQCKLGTREAADGGCEKCPAGTYGSDRPGGALWSTVMRSWDKREPFCERCDPGTYSREGMTRCDICPEGTVAKSYSSKRCKKCPPGSRSEPALAYYEGDTIRSARTTCRTLRDNCEFGRRNRFGNCNEQFCDAGKVLTSSGCSITCGGRERLDRWSGRCVMCPYGSGNRIPHQSTTCTPCPKNYNYVDDDGICQCLKNFIMVENRCDPCGPGKVSVGNKCVSCKVGIPVVQDGLNACIKCVGDQYQATPQSKTCTKCPSGYIRSTDVVGEPTEGCMPKSGYGYRHT